MMKNRYGMAMYTVQRAVAEDMHAAFARLAGLGYESIEFYGDMTFEPEKIRKAIADSGLRYVGWHVEWRDLQPETIEKTVAYLKACGCPVAIIPCLGSHWQIGHTEDQECREVWVEHLKDMIRIQQRLKKDDIRTGYHNHAHEFELSYDGKKLYDFLFDQLPEDFILEFDSGNCIEGGDDPLRVLTKYKDRDMILHMKPYSRTRGFDIMLGDEDDANDWPAYLDPALRKPYLAMLVESENRQATEWENAAQCMEYLKGERK